jgi:cytochrome c biogenesis protein CcmG, thiol:disulfide interchange protein DsbE
MKFFTTLASTLFFAVLLPASAYALEAGAKAPNFSLAVIKNTPAKKITLTDYMGKVVYVDFWASWCGPCQRSFPVLDKLRAKYKNQGFEVLAINMDEKVEDAHGFLTKYPVGFPIAHDPVGKVGDLYQLKGMPSGYIVDRKGVVNYVVVGFDEKAEAATIEAKISALVGSKP